MSNRTLSVLRNIVLIAGFVAMVAGSTAKAGTSDNPPMIEMPKGSEIDFKTPYGQPVRVFCPKQGDGECVISTTLYPNGNLHTLSFGSSEGSYMQAKLLTKVGNQLHSFQSRGALYDEFGQVELDPEGRVITGNLVDEPLQAGEIDVTYRARLTYNNGTYTGAPVLDFSNKKGGFTIPDYKTLKTFCTTKGGWPAEELGDESSIQHKLVYGTELFFDLASGQWLSVTDQPYDYVPVVECQTDTREITFH